MVSAKSIFISYRRRTSIDITGRIYDRLVTHFGENSVFKDVDSIPFGVNFRNHLEREVSLCPVLLAVIDPDWLAVADEGGRPKLANSADWVRIEIETALQRDRLVIPVLVGGATLPEESALPEGLKALAYRQSAQVRCDPDFHRDMDRLIQRVEGVFSSLNAAAAAPANLIDELAAAIATASQITQRPSTPVPTLGRRRWLQLMGLGLVGGGSALALHQRVPALQTLVSGDIHRAVPGLATLPDRLHKALGHLEEPEALATAEGPQPEEPAPEEPEPEESAIPKQYIYESVSVDGFGAEITQVKFSTPAYHELWLDSPSGPVALPLVAIAGGQFVQGAPESEPGYDPAQPVQAIVSVTSFWMGTHPVTQGQWRAVTLLPKVTRDLEADPAHFIGDNLPVEQVSWSEVVEFCDRLNHWLNTHSFLTSLRRLRLPTEIEWEYACRAKTTTPFHTGETLTTSLANYNGTQPYRQEPVGKFRGMTMPVGIFGKANDFGLYDMHGNVLEWCSPGNGEQPTNDWRVVRGGSWQSPPQDCRSAYRAGFKAGTHSNQIGFRIVAEVS